jgi:acyl-CoA reductase-like NAD-dependent aldehyde dehydrogenase
MIRPEERAKVHKQVLKAHSRGAEFLTGGRIPPDKDRGFFYEPTVLSRVTEDMAVMREETFGRVLPVVQVEDSRWPSCVPMPPCMDWKLLCSRAMHAR